MPTLFSSRNSSSIKCFEIRVREDHLILRGPRDEASSVVLEGDIVLCTTEPIKVLGVSMVFKGKARIPETSHIVGQVFQIYRHVFKFDEVGKASSTLPAGNLVLPFSLILEGNMFESVEGMPDAWVVYGLKATIDRGIFAKNVDARKHIRIIRTYDPTSLELSYGMAMANIWPDKLKYNITTPSKGVVFGSIAQIDYELVPLIKGLKIGKITTDISEISHYHDPRFRERGMKAVQEREVVIFREDYKVPEDVETEPIEGLDGYRFNRQLQLPRNLRKCRQTVEGEEWIVIRHRYNFVVELLNPDGHISEIRANLPVHIFIAPETRLDAKNEVQGPVQVNSSLLGDSSTLAPPLYGQHELDPLYSGVDPGHFVTPAQSGPNTPFSESRRTSADYLSVIGNAEVSANTLRNRLGNLTEGGNSEDGHPLPESVSDSGTVGGWMVPRPGNQTPQHLEYNDEELARIPSYNTALRNPFPNTTTSDLPDYFTSTSQPSSPPNRTSPNTVSRSALLMTASSDSLPRPGGSRPTSAHQHVHYAADHAVQQQPQSR